MGKVFKTLLLGLLVFTSSCDELNQFVKTVDTESEGTKLTNSEVIAGLKEALGIGIQKAVDITSLTDGFLKNTEIALPFPESAYKIKLKAMEWGLDSQVEKIVTTLNRAAEDAVKTAGPIFVNAVRNMSINDGFVILKGGDGAATEYLRITTTDELVKAFSPKVQASIERVKLTDYWNPVATRYNQAMMITGGEKIETDLNKYVTERAISGLFVMVEKEENKIRKDPAARVTDLLTKVFGSIVN